MNNEKEKLQIIELLNKELIVKKEEVKLQENKLKDMNYCTINNKEEINMQKSSEDIKDSGTKKIINILINEIKKIDIFEETKIRIILKTLIEQVGLAKMNLIINELEPITSNNNINVEQNQIKKIKKVFNDLERKENLKLKKSIFYKLEEIININKLIEFISLKKGNIDSSNLVFLIKILNNSEKLSKIEKNKLLLGIIGSMFKKIENKKEIQDKLYYDYSSYQIEEQIKNLFDKYRNKEIKYETILENEVNVTKEKYILKDLINLFFQKISKYLNKIENIVEEYEIIYEISPEKLESLNEYHYLAKKIPTDNYDIENIEYAIDYENLNIKDYKSMVFIFSFDFFTVLRKEYNIIYEMYNNEKNIDKFIDSLTNITDIRSYISLIEELKEYFEIISFDEEFKKFSYFVPIFNKHSEKNEEINTNNNKCIGKNILLLSDNLISDSFDNYDLNDNPQLNKDLIDGLNKMRDRDYKFLAQDGKVKTILSVDNNEIKPKRFRNNNSRIAFITLDVSEKVKKIIKERFNYESFDGNQVILILGYAEKKSDSVLAYSNFLKTIYKTTIKGNKTKTIINSEITNIQNLFSLKEPTKEEQQLIIDIINNSNNIYMTIENYYILNSKKLI